MNKILIMLLVNVIKIVIQQLVKNVQNKVFYYYQKKHNK